ncbi:MAG: murein biosynthesis integral membrane protein MurJ [Kiritimatiellia bacterium]
MSTDQQHPGSRLRSVSAHKARLVKSASVVSLMTLLSRIGGLVREMIMAYFFGTSALKSAFDIAFLVPNLFRRLFGEGALAGAFVPVFNRELQQNGRSRANRLAMHVIGLLVITLSAVVLAGIGVSFLLPAVLPTGSQWLLPLPMIRLLLPYAVLICVAAMVAGMLNSVGRFAVSAFAPFVLNVVWIAALLIICSFIHVEKSRQLMILCGVVLVAGMLQILIQIPVLIHEGFYFRPSFKGILNDTGVIRILTLMGPAVLGAGILQINVCVDKILAYWAGSYGPAALGYAERFIYLPLGIFGTAFMTVLLPAFSRHAANDELFRVADDLEDALVNLTLVMLPCAFGLGALARPVMSLVYGIGNGAFDAESSVLTSRALCAYLPGLLIFSFNKAVVPAFYGMQDIKTPTKVSLSVLILNVALNICSVVFFPVGWKHAGIALSTVVCSTVSVSVLYFIFRRRICAINEKRLVSVFSRALLCAGLMAFATRFFHVYIVSVLPDCGACRLISVLTAVILAIMLYSGFMAVFCAKELSHLGNVVLKHVRRRND